MPDRTKYAVFGHPVSHSKSPLIHRAFARQFDEDIDYTAVDVEPGHFRGAVLKFRDQGGAGLNVTVPYKIEAWELADEKSGRAELAGAVNTLRFDNDDIIFGDNTDGMGLLRDLQNNKQLALEGRSILVMGAGGAVRGVLGPLLGASPEVLIIANRTIDKAEALVRIFKGLGNADARSYQKLSGMKFDLVINGTAASLGGEVPPLPQDVFTEDALAYDMMYGARPTAFMEWAAQHGAAQTCDGLGMLVEQAAESFFIWQQKRPQTQPVIKEIRDSLSSA